MIFFADQSSASYPWRAFFNNFLSYSKVVKETKLRGTNYYWDDDEEDAESPYSCSTSTALAKRNKWIEDSKRCNSVIEIHCDVLKCSRLLPPGEKF